MKYDNKSISKNIKAMRAKAGLTQEETAEKLKMTRASYSSREKEPRKYSLEKLEQMAELFGCSVGDFFMD